MMIDGLNAAKEGQEQSLPINKATANMKTVDLYRLVASLIVEKVIQDEDAEAEFEAEDRQVRELKN